MAKAKLEIWKKDQQLAQLREKCKRMEMAKSRVNGIMQTINKRRREMDQILGGMLMVSASNEYEIMHVCKNNNYNIINVINYRNDI